MYCFHKCFLRTWEVLQTPEKKSNEEACFPLQRLSATCLVAFLLKKKKKKNNKTTQKTLYFSITIIKQNLKKMKGKFSNWTNLN